MCKAQPEFSNPGVYTLEQRHEETVNRASDARRLLGLTNYGTKGGERGV